MATKIAVVTGSNKGIGLQVVKDIAKKFDGLVYLTARDEGRGKAALGAAAAELGAHGAKLRFHALDIDDQGSIGRFRDFLQKEHGRLDVLVNNAGIAFTAASTAPFAEQAAVTNKTNYFGTRNVCHALFPLLVDHARVVTVASRVGTMTVKALSADMLAKFSSAATEAAVDDLMDNFIKLAQSGAHKDAGYADSSYGMSKLGVIVLSEVQGKTLAADGTRKDVILNSVCPGYVDTDMSSHKGTLSVAQGADSIVYLALLPPDRKDNPVAAFVGNRKAIDWRKGQTREEAFGGAL